MEEIKTKHLALKHNIRKLDSVIENATQKRYVFQKELEEVCPHNQRKEKHHFVEGGYLNQAEYRTDIYCDFCGKLLETGETTYGGFS